MATINSNRLGVYALEAPQTSPLEILDTTTVVGSLVDSDLPASTGVGEYTLVVNGLAFVGIVERAAAAASPIDKTGSLSLLGLSTSTSLEAQNSVTETAARNGSGASTNHIVSGAMTWSTSVDGLLDVTAGAGSAITLMDAARQKYYVIAKFDMDEGSSNTFYAGQAVIDSVSLTGGVDDIATYSASLSGFGDLYKG